ncbi:hypothetical protein VP01_4640g1 [Puccinia sorghi]|uniref:Uncharacterized protein n=1 Tax=Puccinia sorghi TaxID=27349 RepID=A0A0L6UP39_9BASI|nr:hypothetical protein VP01_4640g1 [Puccinia sorghi]
MNLDKFIKPHTDKLIKRPDYKSKRKQVTTFIRLHLGQEDSTRFVDDLESYDPKTLWELIVSYHAAKSIKNASNVMEKLHDIVFVEGEMQKSINLFRQKFHLMIEVSSSKFDKKTLEAVWVFFVLKKLPPSFSVFSSALAVQNISWTSSSGISTFTSGQKRQSLRPVCSNGTHNPTTAHTKDNCHQLNPDKAVAYFKAAIDNVNSSTAKHALLSANNVLKSCHARLSRASRASLS